MRRWSRIALSAVAVLGVAGTLLAVGAASGSPGAEAPSSAEQDTAAQAGPPQGRDRLAQDIAGLQATLDRAPGNERAWTELGFAYVQQARLSADPGLYARAEGAFAKALALRPTDNDEALTGQASLAAARHDFAEALALTDRSIAINAYSPTTFAVRSDALTELGRYADAQTAVQTLLDLRPGGLDGLSRASYVFELRGDVGRAEELLEQAAEAAVTPPDIAFTEYFRGELAFNNGDLTAARAAYDRAIEADPTSLQSVAGRAKVLAATGETTASAADYRTVVERLPLPEYLAGFGELLEATGQQQEAEEQYAVLRATQQLYAAGGQDVDTELAIFEANHGTPAAALASAEKAYAKRPQAIFTQDAYAWALHAAGRSKEALPIAKTSTRLGLRSPALYYRLGTIAAAAGDTATARTALSRALELNPAFSPLHAPKAQALLKTLR